jgi:hypothetical protein
MKKKFRTITVKGITYGWTLNVGGGDTGKVLNIWHDKKIVHSKKMEYNFDGNDAIEITPRVVRKVILEMLGEPPEPDRELKESVKFLIANKKHYDAVTLYTRQAFHAFCEKVPFKKGDGAFRGYDSYEILDENTIKVLFVFGAYEMEYEGCFYIDVNTNAIKAEL